MERLSYRGISITKRGARWRWQVCWEGQNRTGSAESLAAAKRELDRILDRRETARARRTAAALRSITIAELLDDWFRWKRARLAPATERQYGIHIRVHIVPLIGDADASAIKPRELEAFYSKLRWKSAKESHHILNQAFEWGLRNEVLLRESNPCSIVRPSRRTSTDHDGYYDTDNRIEPIPEKDIPTKPEIQKLLVDAIEREDWRWWLYLKVGATTAARPGEVCALQRLHIDIERYAVRIEWNADRVGGRVKRPKTPWSVRSLPIDPTFFDEIAPWLPDEPGAYLFPSNTQPGARSPLPCWNSRGVHRRFTKALARCWLPHYTPHALRHYGATRLLAAGMDPLQLARFLGHADDTLVRKRYANHIIDEHQRRIGAAAAQLT